MWQPAQAARLSDGRLHLHHGPIDLIIEAWGADAEQAYEAATATFADLLATLATELPVLRQPVTAPLRLQGPVARRMHAAVLPFAAQFITPMAAVAGAVADHVLAGMLEQSRCSKAYVNNGGDIALHVDPGQHLTIAFGGGVIGIDGDARIRGIATSGWRGRSQSLGIADAVTVLAGDAATADAAATMIANEVNLPGHPGIRRVRADSVAPESDLGDRLITTDVSPLTEADIDAALTAGEIYARSLWSSGRIAGALLTLQGQRRHIGPLPADDQ